MGIAWLPPDGFIALPAPSPGDGFRLGEVVVVAHETEAATAEHLAEHVVEAGYEALPGTEDWQHFRPLSVWWHGIGRHARLRRRDLHVRASRARPSGSGRPSGGGVRIYAAGLLTAALEHRLGLLGTLYVPAPAGAGGGVGAGAGVHAPNGRPPIGRLAPRGSAAPAGSWSGARQVRS
jgi:hypothetical protein